MLDLKTASRNAVAALRKARLELAQAYADLDQDNQWDGVDADILEGQKLLGNLARAHDAINLELGLVDERNRT